MAQQWKGKVPQLDVEKVREVLVAFYAEHNPERITNIDPILEKYCGYEVELLKSLKEKYNVDDHPLIDRLLENHIPRDQYIHEVSDAPTIRHLSSQGDTNPAWVTNNISADSSGEIQHVDNGGTSSSTFAGLSSIGLSNAAGRLLSGVSWGLNNESFAFVAATATSDNNDLSSSTKLFRMQAEIDKLEQDKVSLESLVQKLQIQVAAIDESSMETKDLQLKQSLLEISIKLETQLESLVNDRKIHIDEDEPYPSHIKDRVRKLMDCRSHDQLISEALYLRELLEIFRVFTLEVISNSLLTSRFYPDRGYFPQLRDKLAFYCQKVGLDWSNFDEIREEAYVLEVELEKTRKLLQMKDLELQRIMGTLKAMDHEIMLTKEYIDSSNMARQQISTVCGDRMRQVSLSSDERVQQVRDRLLFEREDVFSNLSHVSILQQHWQVEVSKEQQREISRLRDEVTKSRRQEAQREKEVAFLQRQLQEAANRLARFEDCDNYSSI